VDGDGTAAAYWSVMPDSTPPLWFTRSAAAQMWAVARRGCRAASAAYAAGRIGPADWRDALVAAVNPAVAAAARLSRAAEFGVADRAHLYERLSLVREAAHDLSLRLAPADPAARDHGLRLAQSVRAAAAAYERTGRRAPGPAWERRIAGPGCPPDHRTGYGAWRPAGELPTPGDDFDCLCRLEYFSGAEPPPVAPACGRVSFRVWTAGEVAGLSPDQLRGLSPDDAADAIEQLREVLDDSRLALLEQIASPPAERGFPPNGAGNHFSADDPDPARLNYLPMLVAAPDPACTARAEAAGRLVRAARLFGATSRRAYFRHAGGYDAARAALHERLAAGAVLAVPPAAGTPQALLVVGPRAGGKSRAADAKAAELLGAWATADALSFAAQLPEYQGWNAALLADEGGDVAALAIEAALASGRNLVVECHGHEPFTAGRAAHRLAGAGYAVHGLAVTCPAATARARAAARFAANPFGLRDPLSDPSAFTPEADPGTKARDLAGYPGLSSWATVEGV
jgi:hypothetical protein